MRPPPISTTAPLPNLWQLFFARRVSPDDPKLTSAWCSSPDEAVLLARASWALVAAIEGISQERESAPRVWVPDYFCNAALAGIRRTGATLEFYPVDESFQPNWSSCAAMAAAAPPHVFVVVHYFGWPADMDRAHDFCRTHGAALIEDAAHLLAPTAKMGRQGDYTIWSLYKHIPAPSGGLLVVRPNAPGAAAALSAARHMAASAPAPTDLWAIRRALQVSTPWLARRLMQPALAFADDPPIQTIGAPAAGRLARRLIAAGVEELSVVAGRRRANEAAVRSALSDAPGLKAALPPATDVGALPYRAVFRADTTERAQFWYQRLSAMGNAVETWPDLPPEVRAAPERHAGALALRSTCFALPVHADRGADELAAAYRAAVF